MHGTGAFVWFVVTTVLFLVLMTVGTWLAIHSYEHG
jgi:hypothetical protein